MLASFGFGFGRRVVADRLEIDLRVLDVGPLPAPSSSASGERPCRRNSSSHSGSFFFAEISRIVSSLEALGRDIRLDVGDETVLVGPVDEVLQQGAHASSFRRPPAFRLKLSPQPQVLSTFGLSTLNGLLQSFGDEVEAGAVDERERSSRRPPGWRRALRTRARRSRRSSAMLVGVGKAGAADVLDADAQAQARCRAWRSGCGSARQRLRSDVMVMAGVLVTAQLAATVSRLAKVTGRVDRLGA